MALVTRINAVRPPEEADQTSQTLPAITMSAWLAWLWTGAGKVSIIGEQAATGLLKSTSMVRATSAALAEITPWATRGRLLRRIAGYRLAVVIGMNMDAVKLAPSLASEMFSSVAGRTASPR